MTASEGGSEQEARRLDILLRSRHREGDRVQHHNHHHQLNSVSLINNNNNTTNNSGSSTIKQNNNNNIHNKSDIKKATFGGSHNRSSNEISEENQAPTKSQEIRKLSYVGLSCAVSGYSPYTKYSTELTDIERKVTPPAQIPVASPPYTLDAVLNNYTPMVKPGSHL